MKAKSTRPSLFSAVMSADGRVLSFASWEREKRMLAWGEFAGQKVGVIVKPWKLLRSEQANAYYWNCVLLPMSEEGSGGDQSPEEIHDAMCAMFLDKEEQRVEFFNRMTGESLTVETDGRRSSKLDGERFYTFVEQVRKFALEFMGVRTEDPDPLYWRKRKAVSG